MGKDEPVRYVCSGCGHRTTTRTRHCPSCGAWGTLEAESGLPARPKSAAARVVSVVAAARLESDVDYRRVTNGKRGKIAGAGKKLGVSGIFFTSRERLFEIFRMEHSFLLMV